MSNPEPPLLPLLTQLCDALTGPERRGLVFLCNRLDSDHSLVTTREVLEATLFHSERPLEVVRELLLHLGRLDLLRTVFQCGRQEVERQQSSLSKYRVLMVNLSENMTQKDLDTFKFLLGPKLPRDRLERAKCFLDIVTELEKQGHESERVELIETCMKSIGRMDLARRVRTLTAPEQTPLQMQLCSSIQPFSSCQPGHMQLFQSAPEQTPPFQPWCRPLQLLSNCQQTGHGSLLQRAPEWTPPQMQRYRPTQPLTCQPTRHMQLLQSGAGPSPQVLQGEQTFSNSIDHYKLNTGSRGVCIIIDCVGNDGELLQQTFQTLNFTVVLHLWLSVSACLSTLRALQHSPLLKQASVFVCCVISRGTNHHLLATDAHNVGLHLNSLRQMFTPQHCPALAGKPKLFFIQRYSVPEYQPWSYGYSEDLETDGPSLIPKDADVFWSHCWTPESQLQKSGHHSHYLEALMEALQAGHVRKWHVVDLHTRVNAAVYEHNQKNASEQYHLELKHTLTKNVYLN